MKLDTVTLGNLAESAVEAEMIRRGCSVLSRKYRYRRLGEIDLVVADRGAVCFIEVKARSSDRCGTAREAVTPVKLRRIRQVAACYLQEKGFQDREVRILLAAVQIESRGSVSCMEILPFE